MAAASGMKVLALLLLLWLLLLQIFKSIAPVWLLRSASVLQYTQMKNRNAKAIQVGSNRGRHTRCHMCVS